MAFIVIYDACVLYPAPLRDLFRIPVLLSQPGSCARPNRTVGDGSATREVTLLDLFIPQQINKLLIYPKPVSMRWGATKLRSFCADTLGVEPRPDTAFLFTNKQQDTLLLYLVTEDGDQTLTKKLDRGAFLLPAAQPDGPPFVSMRRSALSKLFR